ncbi:MAG TPA: SPOR domain-containing protein [Aestuariivirga sp.]
MPPVAADALAAKLKEQREAAEKLAVQRVAAAKQKTDPAASSPPVAAPGKPKFAFAEPEAAAAKASAPAPIAPPPIVRPAAFPAAGPSGQNAQNASQAPVGYPPAGQQQPPYQSAFAPSYAPAYGQQPPSYRPIDPATGFAQNPAFQPRQPAAQPARPQVPPMGANSAFRSANPSYQAQPMPGRQAPLGQPSIGQPRMPQMPMPQNASGEPRLGPIARDDVFEHAGPAQRGQRRATANDYRQAYQDELSDGYDQDRPRALGWVLTAVILALLVAFGGWYYLQFNKGSKLAAGQNPPAIEAPTTSPKVAADPAAGTAPADQAGKKLIYDRIEGDHEVPGGPLKSSEQAPDLQGGAMAPPAASNNGGAVPLPLPPPPAPNGQQGAIGADGKADVAMITPAAEQSSAANSSPPAPPTTPTTTPTNAASLGDLPMPSGTDAPPAAAVADTAATPAEAVDPVPPEPKVVVKKPAMPKVAKAQSAEPLLLVPPTKPVASMARSTAPKATQQAALTLPASTDNGGGLYGDAPAAAPANPVRQAVASAAADGRFQVQLASFASQAEANAEYQRLAAKHGAIITRYAPIIEPAQVAGTTRYRLNLGPMATNDVAQNVCSTLIAAGERDCLVHQ